ncbi:sorting and assembly machinery component 50 homolog A isoform X2 [Anabrus simplex]|uniref:sorting and assembly machinery component 50 homolog A isoform X2 n=1 Tax=Anabrus simplex TaxID=316456 RepID=UPI0034DD552C
MGTVHAKDQQKPPVVEDQRENLGINGPGDDDVCSGKTGQHKFVSLDGLQARVDKIHIDGLVRTKDDIVVETVRDLFKAKDFQEVIVGAHAIRGKLEALGCFRNIGIFIDTSSGPGATPNGLEVTFHVRELKRIIGGVNSLIGNNEGSLVVGMKMPNLFGRGEKLQTEYSYGSKRTTGFNVSLSKPLRGKMNSVFTSTIFQVGSEWPWSGYKQIERGLLFDVAFTSAPKVKHNLQWEAAWRDLSTLTRSAAFQVREQAGPSLKSSLRHILSVDRRDAPIFPTTGALFQLTTEFAGLGGNVGFFKNEMLLQGNFPLTSDMVIQGAIQAGLLKRLTNDKVVSMCDEFFLGGPLNLRGFETRGVGPHSDGCALGADISNFKFIPNNSTINPRFKHRSLFNVYYYIFSNLITLMIVFTFQIINIHCTLCKILDANRYTMLQSKF